MLKRLILRQSLEDLSVRNLVHITKTETCQVSNAVRALAFRKARSIGAGEPAVVNMKPRSLKELLEWTFE